MFILLNGSFGIGKTTTARALAATCGRMTIFDPEPIGIVMQRAARLVGMRIDDFQDVPLWHRLAARGAKRQLRDARIVIVPMAFSNLQRFEDLTRSLRDVAFVLPICLKAPLQTVRERLTRRARLSGRKVSDWESLQAEECCKAHTSETFGHAVDATQSTVEIVLAIRALLESHLRCTDVPASPNGDE